MGKRKYNTEEERKEAIRIRNKEWRDNNKDKVKKMNENYCALNREKINLKGKEYYNNNVDKVNKHQKEYNIINKEKIKKYHQEYRQNNPDYNKEYYQNNKEKIIKHNIEYERNKLITDKSFKLKHNIKTLIRQSFRKNGYSKSSKTADIIGCTFDEFKQYIEAKFLPWMNWDNYGRYNGTEEYGWDIDHRVPLASATTEHEIIKLNHYSNLQPLCRYINRVVKKNSVNN